MDATLRILISNWIENRVREKKKNGSIWISENDKNSRLYSSLMDGLCTKFRDKRPTSVHEKREFFLFYLFFFLLRSIFERIRINDHPFDRGAKFRNLLFMCNPWLQVYSRWIITVASSVLVARTLSCPNTVWCATPIATWTRHISGVRNVRLPVEV